MSAMVAWFTPARRRDIYAALAALGGILAAVGWVTDAQIAAWLGIANATLSVGALIVASYNARQVRWTAVYRAGALLVGSLTVAGYVHPAAADSWLRVLTAVCAAAPLVLAVLRTDPSTPTGEPAAEYAARHASPQESAS